MEVPFFSKEKSAQHQEGVGYLTSHRLIYVDAKDPRKNSVQLELASIKSIDTYVSHIAIPFPYPPLYLTRYAFVGRIFEQIRKDNYIPGHYSSFISTVVNEF